MSLQRADQRLNAQMLTNQLDDALESLGGRQSMHSSVAATVRGTARQQATGADRTKDKADRATYQTVLDPRTRLVRHPSHHITFIHYFLHFSVPGHLKTWLLLSLVKDVNMGYG